MTPRVRQYAQDAADRRGVLVEDILGRSRKRAPSHARFEVMQALRRDGFTCAQIGRWLGRDHTTVIYGLRVAVSKPKAPSTIAPPARIDRNTSGEAVRIAALTLVPLPALPEWNQRLRIFGQRA